MAISSLMTVVTRILSAIEQGEPHAEQLLPLVYNELRRLAADKIAKEKTGQTLQATALVPALVDGKVYIGTEKQLYAFGE